MKLEIEVRVVWILLIGTVSVLAALALYHGWLDWRTRVRYEEVFRPLTAPDYNETDGFRVGDISENFRLGKIPGSWQRQTLPL